MKKLFTFYCWQLKIENMEQLFGQLDNKTQNAIIDNLRKNYNK